MKRGSGRLRRRVARVAGKPVGELMEIFGPCIALPENFGNPGRKRLFSPRTDLLAFFVASARRR